MDYIKRDTQVFDPLHYIDYPFKQDGDFVAPEPESVNAIMGLTQAANTLIYKGETSLAWSKGFSLLLMLHVLGDMHQPLHASSMFSQEKNLLPPLGDMGGNLYNIVYTSETGMTYTQLHLLYDCVGGLYCDYMPHPVTAAYSDRIATIVDGIMKEYPQKALEEEGFDLTPELPDLKTFTKVVTRWAKEESYQLAVESYGIIDYKSEIDSTKIAWMRAMLRKRIALAGYRTAHILNLIDTTITGYDETTVVPSGWRIATISLVMVLAVVLTALAVLYKRYQAALHGQSTDYTVLNN